jgi:aryl-alcohol dehydrogenase-like predicted oxidoreductase
MTNAGRIPELGFGGASMGSRKSVADSLAALRRAHAVGVRWFDVAPSYGDGAAEEVLGRFLKEVGGDASVCTKVGILPGRASLAKRIARPVLRTALELAPGLRNVIKRARPPAEKQPIDGDLIARSIDASLKRLNLDQIEVLALHDATAEEVVRDDVLRALESILAGGKARRVGIASSPEAVAAGISATEIYGHAQIANNPYASGFSDVVDAIGQRDIKLVTHSVFSSPSAAERLAGQIASDSELRNIMTVAGYRRGPMGMAQAFLPDYAFAAERTNVVIMSMFSSRNIEQNLERHRLAATLDRSAIAAIAERIAA